jgi:hypothetical protein
MINPLCVVISGVILLPKRGKIGFIPLIKKYHVFVLISVAFYPGFTPEVTS